MTKMYAFMVVETWKLANVSPREFTFTNTTDFLLTQIETPKLCDQTTVVSSFFARLLLLGLFYFVLFVH